jgi:hypothetical protein
MDAKVQCIWATKFVQDWSAFGHKNRQRRPVNCFGEWLWRSDDRFHCDHLDTRKE